MMRELDVRPAERPIIFLGPSMSWQDARAVLADADYRPPIRRGDLDRVPDGALVGIVDGVFAQDLAVSPREIRNALARRVVIYGASSMGALRAAEVDGVIGVGRVHQLMRDGIVERDDEVALLFNPDTGAAVTEPLVNIRHAVERLVQAGTLERRIGRRIVGAAARLHYGERTYPHILEQARLAEVVDARELIGLLRSFDLKREDAHLLLERIAEHRRNGTSGGWTPLPAVRERDDNDVESTAQAPERAPADAPLLVWEYGDAIAFGDLVRFLKLTGRFGEYARNVLARHAIAGNPVQTELPAEVAAALPTAQSLFDRHRGDWGWIGAEETHVTLNDLGLGLEDLTEVLDQEATTVAQVGGVAWESSELFRTALRAELWMNRLGLKREALRLGALRWFAAQARSGSPPSEEELNVARRVICRLNGVLRGSELAVALRRVGVSDEEREEFVALLALARRAATPVARALDGAATPARKRAPRARDWARMGLRFERSRKPKGSLRFSLELRQAERHTRRIARRIGIRRIGLIGELDQLGVHIAQAFRARQGWSSTMSSGKGESVVGARVGSVMEEAEVYAQDAFQLRVEREGSYEELAPRLRVVDPATLDLPYDTRYTPSLRMRWTECFDLVGARRMWVPSAMVVRPRLVNDILYSERRGCKLFSTNGLASGFTLAEAALHATCEFIERHAHRLAELELENPGGCGIRRFEFVDPETVPESTRRIIRKVTATGMRVRLLDITSEVEVPTFYVALADDPFLDEARVNEGFACHPNPEVALNMALLEAAQTKAGNTAGSREDLTIKARSLGRHERPRTVTDAFRALWFGADPPQKHFATVRGLVARDILEELEWTVERVRRGGYPHLLLVDVTVDAIAPAHAVRVMIPGMESANPFYAGPRARATAIRDLLPRATRTA